MKFFIFFSLIAFCTYFLQPTAAFAVQREQRDEDAVETHCYGSGQPFEDGWDENRIKDACKKLRNTQPLFMAGELKYQCQKMGDDQVFMSVRNASPVTLKLTQEACVRGLKGIFNFCRLSESYNEGYTTGGSFDFKLDPNEGSCKH